MTTKTHRPDQRIRDTHGSGVGSVPDLPLDQPRGETQTAIVEGAKPEDGSAATDRPTPERGPLADPFLALAADVLDDAERTRIANENRLYQLTSRRVDPDGVERGWGLDEKHPDVARLAALVDMLGKVEHQATLHLQRVLRRNPLAPWLAAQKGVGEKQAARLLAAIGDPYLKSDGTPRRVSDLWAYCGHGDPAHRRRKGMSQADAFQCGNPVAKMRVHLIAVSIMRHRGALRDTYDARRVVTAVSHPEWTDGHAMNDALRLLGKEFLRQLWLEAKRLHEQPDGHPVIGTRAAVAVGSKPLADLPLIDTQRVPVGEATTQERKR